MTAGPFFPVQVLSNQPSTLFEEAVMPSWRVTLTEPIGAGCSYQRTSTWTIDAGYCVMHISNGGTRSPNSGLNFGLPFLGLSYQGF